MLNPQSSDAEKLDAYRTEYDELADRYRMLDQQHARLREKALAVNAEWVSAGLPIVTAAMRALRTELEQS